MSRIAIGSGRAVGRLDRKVFGGFVEHLGRCIYGGPVRGGVPRSDDDRVTFAVDPARLYFFDPDTGQAITS